MVRVKDNLAKCCQRCCNSCECAKSGAAKPTGPAGHPDIHHCQYRCRVPEYRVEGVLHFDSD